MFALNRDQQTHKDCLHTQIHPEYRVLWDDIALVLDVGLIFNATASKKKKLGNAQVYLQSPCVAKREAGEV